MLYNIYWLSELKNAIYTITILRELTSLKSSDFANDIEENTLYAKKKIDILLFELLPTKEIRIKFCSRGNINSTIISTDFIYRIPYIQFPEFLTNQWLQTSS